MTIILHGSQHATCTKRVAVVCKELGVPYTLDIVNVKDGEHKKEEYLAKHPFGVIPWAEIDGIDVIESRAISRVIASQYGADSGLIPKAGDLAGLAAFEAAASIEQANFEAYVGQIVYERYFKPMMQKEPDETRVKYLIEQLEGKLDGYERLLAKSKYLAGDHITLPDLFHLPHGSLLSACGVDIAKGRLNVARWWNDVSSRESWISLKAGV